MSMHACSHEYACIRMSCTQACMHACRHRCTDFDLSIPDCISNLMMLHAAVLKTAERKLFWRVLSLNIALMFVNYLDRTNLAFAAVQLNKDIGLSHEVYGLGAGLFFATYATMQVPANMAMTKIGGPIWLGAIALLWGIVAACFALIRDVPEFLALRCLLGLL